MSIITKKFQILSNVQCELDVFNQVVLVKDLETGEQFTLGVAHYCRWTEEQLATADRLEGCYTPADYSQEERLLFSDHPWSPTQYLYQQVDGVVYLTLTVRYPTEEEKGILERIRGRLIQLDYPTPQLCYSTVPNLRVLRTLWTNTVEEDPARRLRIFYRNLRVLEEEGRVKAGLGRLAWEYILKEEYENAYLVHWEETALVEYMSVYFDAVRVYVDRPEKGYMVAWTLNEDEETYQYIYEDEDWWVHVDHNDVVQFSLEITPCGEVSRLNKVLVNRSELGYERAEELPFV